MVIRIADVPVAVDCGDAALRGRIREQFSVFLSHGEPELTIVMQGVGSRAALAPPVYGKRAPGVYMLSFDGMNVVADMRSRMAFVERCPDEHAFSILLRHVLALALLDARGLLLHASGVAREGRGWVFTGPSEAGKSTIARAADERAVLNDEYIAVRKGREQRFRVYATPFWGEMRGRDRNADAEVAGCFFIRKGERDAFRRLDAFETVSRLLPNVYCPFPFPEIAEAALDACLGFIENVTAGELEFTLPVAFWDVLHEYVGEKIPVA